MYANRMTSERLPLTERKRAQARERIVNAAEELFVERGFDEVSVAEIADRAEVGRTTFFRHFRDKQEVVFAQEHQLMAAITAAHHRTDAPVPHTSAAAVEQLREVVVALVAQVTENPTAYTRHYLLVKRHPELKARDTMKVLEFTHGLAAILVTRGAEQATANFASNIALACYLTARDGHGNDPDTLMEATDEAFKQALALGSAPA